MIVEDERKEVEVVTGRGYFGLGESVMAMFGNKG